MNEPKPLPSETKLVETPRTDAVQIDMEQSTNPIGYQAHQYRDLARQLERELDAAQTEIAGLNGIIRVRTAALASLADELRLAREEMGKILQLACDADEVSATKLLARIADIASKHPWPALKEPR